jgi:hypothetical protein
MTDPPPIVVDSREKKPYEFPAMETTVRSLDVGDYTYDGYEDEFVVERKSLDDLANSLGRERNRFEDEIVRAQSLDNFVVVIEAPKRFVYDFRNQGDCPHYYSEIYPNSIIGSVEKWTDKYGTLEFRWCGDRNGAKQETLRLLDSWWVRENIQ